MPASGTHRLYHWHVGNTAHNLTPARAHTLSSIDECGCNIAMIRRYGRAQYGRRVPDAVPKNFDMNVIIRGALSCTGLDAVMTVEGTTDTAVFRAYV